MADEYQPMSSTIDEVMGNKQQPTGRTTDIVMGNKNSNQWVSQWTNVA